MATGYRLPATVHTPSQDIRIFAGQRPTPAPVCVCQALDRWEERLEGIFDGRPYDILDAALTDTVSQYPVHIQPFRDMIDGMRMDLVKSRSVGGAAAPLSCWPRVSMHHGCVHPCQCCTALPSCLPVATACKDTTTA